MKILIKKYIEKSQGNVIYSTKLNLDSNIITLNYIL